MRGMKNRVMACLLSTAMTVSVLTGISQPAFAADQPIRLSREVNDAGFLPGSEDQVEVTVDHLESDPVREVQVYKDGENLELGLTDLDSVRYYVDSVTGSDDNDGRSEQTPWKSLDKVNNTKFEPGSKILFKCGSAWAGNLIVSSSGEEGKLIEYSSYGEGARPLIMGTGDDQDGLTKSGTAAVLIKDKEYVRVKGLAITNLGKKPDGSPNDIKELGENEGLRSGIIVMATRGTSTVLEQIQVVDNEIYNVKGSSNRYPPAGTYDMYHNAGIYMWVEGTEGETAQFDQLLIENNIIRDMSCQGINFNVEDAGHYNFQHDRYHQDVIIRGNSIARTGADAIVTEYCNNILVERNVGYNAGEMTKDNRPSVIAGIWQSNTSNPVFQYNECARTRYFRGDGMAWDTDWGSGGTSLYQYNYSHENEGGMLMDCNFNSPNYENWIMRYNLSVNEPGTQWTIVTHNRGNLEFYNNTVYIAPGGGRIYIHEASGLKNEFYNNIFVADEITYDNSISAFRNNLIWGHGNEVSLPAQAVNTYIADPKFADTTAADTTGETVNSVPVLAVPHALDGMDAARGWQLSSDSPAINRGIGIENNGGKDMLGNPLYHGAPDIGMHEYQGDYTGDGSVDKAAHTSANIQMETYDSTDAANVRTSRISPESLNEVIEGISPDDSFVFEKVVFDQEAQSFVWTSKGEQAYQLKVLADGQELGTFDIAASDDYDKQIFHFDTPLSPGDHRIVLQFSGDGAKEALVDQFAFTQLSKPYDIPYTFTFEDGVDTWKTLGSGFVQVEDGKLVYTAKDNPERFLPDRSPLVKDGIVEGEITAGGNGSTTILIRFDTLESSFVEVGMDVGNYWFLGGTGIANQVFPSGKCPAVTSGQTYRIKVKFVGEHFTVWIDDKEVFNQEVPGAKTTSGAVGINKWSRGYASLDNLKVNSGTLNGQVIGSNGVGVEGVTITLDDGRGTQTDSRGNYTFYNLVWGKEYTVTGHAPTGSLPEQKVTTSMDQDTAKLTHQLEIAGADKTELRAAIAKAQSYLEGDYDPVSWADMSEKLTAAIGVEGNVNATQGNVEDALTELEESMNALVMIDTPFELPYTNDFTNSQAGWKGMRSTSAASVQDGKLFLHSGARNDWYLSGRTPEFADGTIEYEFTPAEPDGVIGGKGSMMFRVSEDGSQFVEVGTDALNDSYWFLSGTGVSGNKVFADAPKLTAGTTYQMKVQFEGEHITVWVDGAELFNETLAGVRTQAGRIGIRTWDPTKLYFDNIKVSKPETENISGISQEISGPADTAPNTEENAAVTSESKNSESTDPDQTAAVVSENDRNMVQAGNSSLNSQAGTACAFQLQFPDGEMADYRIVASTVSGEEFIREFRVDRKAPVIPGITDGNEYKASVKVSVQEENLKTLQINGVDAENGTVVTEPDTYQITAIDQAGNTTVLNFSIKDEKPIGPDHPNDPDVVDPGKEEPGKVEPGKEDSGKDGNQDNGSGNSNDSSHEADRSAHSAETSDTGNMELWIFLLAAAVMLFAVVRTNMKYSGKRKE
ncbi:family 16 glycoside hydrolase [Diplocloster hominis]|uniref:family 16 glycoside hydrolase n=1 Tax=Diplocloster hominis TaxID=3079010 RepID=UPI0031BB1BD2